MENLKLQAVEKNVAGCRLCELSETRTNIVFGTGNPNAEVMFIGEAPGKQEDLGAEPFIGSAGKLLNSLLERANIRREDIYIANILKCRPPSNRDPLPQEIEVCAPYLRAQVLAVAPIILVTLGNFATRFILKTDRGITGLRGSVHITGAFSVLPTFHPAAAIYDRQKLPKLEADFDLLGQLLERRHSELGAREEASQGVASSGVTGDGRRATESCTSDGSKSETCASEACKSETLASDGSATGSHASEGAGDK
jgi:DNA polymerase